MLKKVGVLPFNLPVDTTNGERSVFVFFQTNLLIDHFCDDVHSGVRSFLRRLDYIVTSPNRNAALLCYGQLGPSWDLDPKLSPMLGLKAVIFKCLSHHPGVGRERFRTA